MPQPMLTKVCEIVGAALMKMGRPIAADATESAQATIDIRSYVYEGGFTFTNNLIDNTGQNVKMSNQYGQDTVDISFTMFCVKDDDPGNPLNILRKAQKEHLAIPIYYKETESPSSDGYDGDVVVGVKESPIPASNEVKVKVTLKPCNNYRIWQRLGDETPQNG